MTLTDRGTLAPPPEWEATLHTRSGTVLGSVPLNPIHSPYGIVFDEIVEWEITEEALYQYGEPEAVIVFYGASKEFQIILNRFSEHVWRVVHDPMRMTIRLQVQIRGVPAHRDNM